MHTRLILEIQSILQPSFKGCRNCRVVHPLENLPNLSITTFVGLTFSLRPLCRAAQLSKDGSDPTTPLALIHLIR